MANIAKLFLLLCSIATISYTFYVFGRFTSFLSTPRSISKAHTWIFNLLDNKSRLETAYGPIVLDTLYVIAFIFQHSFLKSAFVKNLLRKLGLATAERTIYALTSSLCLHHLVTNWLPAPSIVLWQFDVDESPALWWTFLIFHAICWLVIFGGCAMMDLQDLLGIKQAYYSLHNYSLPSAYKSPELHQLYSHVRHPSFVGFTLILFVTNVMSVDRLLLAVLLTSYMFVAWSTDQKDVFYQKVQLERKKRQLKAF
ncbi:nurim homolog [Drosophila sulfurigaster albostrigata]|uniref:nurim homolog n=1 Tax=Drosophila sulfurigaster albostrigata TaxID=89887 RepID=UPI002D21928A|nr:nurim homolog [Drosophila sulfurigaster albostrigata]